jgi:hypothetical protein
VLCHPTTGTVTATALLHRLGLTPRGGHLNDRHEHARHPGVGQVYEVGAFGRLGDTQHLKAHRARHAALGGQRVVRERRARIELEDLDLWGKGRTRRGEHLHARIELENLDLQRAKIKGNQGQSRAIKGNQELEDLDLQRAKIKGNQGQSRAIKGNQELEDLDLQRAKIKGNQGQSRAIKGNQELEDLDLQRAKIKGNQGQSRAIKGNQGQSRAIKGNQGRSHLQRASRVISNHSDVEPACGHPARACDEPRVDVTKLVDVTNHESR